MHRTTLKFVSRIVVGLIISILLGKYIDELLNTTPIIMIGLIFYVIIGSLLILIKESKHE